MSLPVRLAMRRLAAPMRVDRGCLDGPGQASMHRGRAMKKCGEVFIGIDIRQGT